MQVTACCVAIHSYMYAQRCVRIDKNFRGDANNVTTRSNKRTCSTLQIWPSGFVFLDQMELHVHSTKLNNPTAKHYITVLAVVE